MIQTLVVGSYSENEHESFISEKNNGQYLLPVIKLEPGVKEPWVVVSTVRDMTAFQVRKTCLMRSIVTVGNFIV